jgi:hypothetical protein
MAWVVPTVGRSDGDGKAEGVRWLFDLAGRAVQDKAAQCMTEQSECLVSDALACKGRWGPLLRLEKGVTSKDAAPRLYF